MNDDRLLSEVRAWLLAGEKPAPDAREAARGIRAQLPRTRRRGARPWALARMTKDDATVSTLAIDGRSQQITGRTRSMFSPTRIIVVGLVAIVAGSALAMARPFDPADEATPAAVSDTASVGPVEFTGVGTDAACVVPATTGIEGPVAHTRGASCGPTYSFSDPRLEGTVTWSSNVDEYVDDSGLVIQSVAMSIKNDKGAWKMVPILSASAPGSLTYDATRQFFLVGEGAYDGLVAVVDGFRTDELHGFIIDGELPPAPETAVQTQQQP